MQLNCQKLFDYVANKLIEQGSSCGKYKKNEFMCLYRDNQGRKCAFGFLIPDELYSPMFENRTSTSVLEIFGEKSKALVKYICKEFGYTERYDMNDEKTYVLQEPDRLFIRRLQNLHDNQLSWSDDGSKIKDTLKAFASANNLVVNFK